MCTITACAADVILCTLKRTIISAHTYSSRVDGKRQRHASSICRKAEISNSSHPINSGSPSSGTTLEMCRVNKNGLNSDFPILQSSDPPPNQEATLQSHSNRPFELPEGVPLIKDNHSTHANGRPETRV